MTRIVFRGVLQDTAAPSGREARVRASLQVRPSRLASLVAAGFLFGACSVPAADPQAAPETILDASQAGPLRLSGTVEAVRSRSVLVPRLRGAPAPMVITFLIPAGTRVEPGDLLVEFDRQEQERLATDSRAELVDLEGQIAKKQADQTAAEAKDRTELVAAENDVSRGQLAVQTNDLIAAVEAEKNTLSLEQARAKLEQLRTTFQLKREAAQADVRILEIRRERAASALEYAESNAGLMEVRAPFAGLVVIKTMYKGTQGLTQILEGDEVRPGQGVVDIVDTSLMQVRARVNQADASYVRPGMAAKIRLDGFPELAFDGSVDHVTPLATSSAYSPAVRTVTAIIAIEGTDEQLLPDLTASVEILPIVPAPAPSPPGSR